MFYCSISPRKAIPAHTIPKSVGCKKAINPIFIQHPFSAAATMEHTMTQAGSSVEYNIVLRCIYGEACVREHRTK